MKRYKKDERDERNKIIYCLILTVHLDQDFLLIFFIIYYGWNFDFSRSLGLLMNKYVS